MAAAPCLGLGDHARGRRPRGSAGRPAGPAPRRRTSRRARRPAGWGCRWTPRGARSASVQRTRAACARAPPSRVRGVDGQQPAAGDHRDPVGELLDLVEVVRGEQDRGAVGAQRRGPAPRTPGGPPGRSRSSARRGTAARAARRCRGRRRAGGAGRRTGSGCAGAAAVSSPTLPDHLVRVERVAGSSARSAGPAPRTVSSALSVEPCRTIPSRARQAGPPSRRVDAEDGHLAAVAPAVALEDLHRRRLAGTVRAEQREHLARRDVQVDPVDDGARAVPLAQAAHPHDASPAAGVLQCRRRPVLALVHDDNLSRRTRRGGRLPGRPACPPTGGPRAGPRPGQPKACPSPRYVGVAPTSRSPSSRCSSGKRSHSSPALACRNHTRPPTREPGRRRAGQRGLHLAAALALEQLQAARQHRPHQPGRRGLAGRRVAAAGDRDDPAGRPPDHRQGQPHRRPRREGAVAVEQRRDVQPGPGRHLVHDRVRRGLRDAARAAAVDDLEVAAERGPDRAGRRRRGAGRARPASGASPRRRRARCPAARPPAPRRT